MGENIMLAGLQISDLTLGGAGVGKLDGKAMFVHGAFPGDVVSATVVKSRKKWGEAMLEKVVSPSPLRRRPPCRYFDDCGGCPWMPLGREKQAEYKTRIVADQLRRFGKCDVEPSGMVAPSEEFGYRARVQLHSDFHEGRLRLGFHARKTNDVIDIADCLIANRTVNDAIKSLRLHLSGNMELARRKGRFEIETGYPENGARLNIRLKGDDPIPDISGLLQQPGQIGSVRISNNVDFRMYGEPHLDMDVGGMVLSYGTGVFSQVNPAGNAALVETVLEYARDVSGGCLDLYCGVGNFAFPLAKKGYSVTGVELSGEAVQDARDNAMRLGLSADFVAGDSVETALRMAAEGRRFPLVVLDPPRIGAYGIGTVAAKLGAKRVVYVSCDPSSLARDTQGLVQNGYALEKVLLVDMFPQSFHIESVALFSKG